MDRRVELNNKLRAILGTDNVYFQPPSDIRLTYPCIVYNLDGADVRRADNVTYGINKYYQVTYIDRRPDSIVVDKLLSFPHSSLQSTIRSDGLNQYVFRMYY